MEILHIKYVKWLGKNDWLILHTCATTSDILINIMILIWIVFQLVNLRPASPPVSFKSKDKHTDLLSTPKTNRLICHNIMWLMAPEFTTCCGPYNLCCLMTDQHICSYITSPYLINEWTVSDQWGLNTHSLINAISSPMDPLFFGQPLKVIFSWTQIILGCNPE